MASSSGGAAIVSQHDRDIALVEIDPHARADAVEKPRGADDAADCTIL